MGWFSKECEYCKVKLEKGSEFSADVKVPEFKGFKEMPFCSCEHAEKYVLEVKGTKRTRFCPSCPV